MKCGAMFSPSGAFPDVDAIIGDKSPAMVMKPRHNKALTGYRTASR
ncbi:hypothetical protein ACS8OZ_002336 [Salmonella enterica]|nr:hypothetical protein [Salmonella enterica]HDI5134830.1 hypothetical protein [Salmonella enterica subsp. enterica serovar Paratyphi C]EEQ0500552.1 hypothetical protein [Salmonella enterica subsp. enterica serovar Bareilly]EEV5157911.1 hypothetical protein [Salmonella enterica subsp. enterica serovar Bareilly]EFQ9928532.1 hypothetical protein [Salmonella enterica]EFR0038545.1 hypothetical protein [Salmonella enterica]